MKMKLPELSVPTDLIGPWGAGDCTPEYRLDRAEWLGWTLARLLGSSELMNSVRELADEAWRWLDAEEWEAAEWCTSELISKINNTLAGYWCYYGTHPDDPAMTGVWRLPLDSEL